MGLKKKIDLENLILDLLKQKQELSLHDVAQAAGLSKTDEGERKAIRRILNTLAERGLLKTKGEARARVYVTTLSVTETATQAFKDIPLSQKSEALLQYVSQSLQMRMPVAYDQNFLRSYEPNRSFYLTDAQRAELLKKGSLEKKRQAAGTYARSILNRLLIDLSWNSSRLEGNTYTLLETKRLIELGETATGKDASEAQMILNHKRAIEYVVESSEDELTGAHEVCSIHALLSENLLGDPGASGRVRSAAVGIGGTTYMPLENPHVLNECFQLFIKKLNLIENPFEQSFFSWVHLSYMQAFEDVNKRTARLVANIPLIKHNLNPLSFADVEQETYVKSLLGIYEKNDVSLVRDLYMWAYTRSCHRYSAIQQTMGEPNLLKLKYRDEIQLIIRSVVLEKTVGSHIVSKIKTIMREKNLPENESVEVFKLIETEIVSLHEGNIARFKIRPSEFNEWKRMQ